MTELSHSLHAKGWVVIDDFIGSLLAADLLDESRQLRKQGHFHSATVGQSEQNRLAADVRHSSLWWWPEQPLSDLQNQVLESLRSLMGQIKRSTFLPIENIEIHYGYYPEGGYYRRHRDRFQNSRQRLISFILYLDIDWQPAEGGALLIYNERQPEQLDQQIFPRQGRLALFLSESIEHEVTVTHRERHTITGWMRTGLS